MGNAPLNRRQFLHLVASGVAAEILLPQCDSALQAELASGLPAAFQDNEVHLKKRATRRARATDRAILVIGHSTPTNCLASTTPATRPRTPLPPFPSRPLGARPPTTPTRSAMIASSPPPPTTDTFRSVRTKAARSSSTTTILNPDSTARASATSPMGTRFSAPTIPAPARASSVFSASAICASRLPARTSRSTKRYTRPSATTPSFSPKS